MSEALEEAGISIDEVAEPVWLLPARSDNPERSATLPLLFSACPFIVVEDTYAALAAARRAAMELS